MLSEFTTVLDDTVSHSSAAVWLARDGWLRRSGPPPCESVFDRARDREAEGSSWEHRAQGGVLRLSVDHEFGIVFATYSEAVPLTMRRQAEFAMGALALSEVIDRVRSSSLSRSIDGLTRLGFLAPREDRALCLAWTAGLFHRSVRVQLSAVRAVAVLTAVLEVPMTSTLAAAVDELAEDASGGVRTAALEVGRAFGRLLRVENAP